VRLLLRKMTVGFGIVCLAVLALAMYGAGGVVIYWAVGLPLPCGGQCQSPYSLQVTFKPGTSYQADTTAMVRCTGHSPEVTGIEPAGLDPNHSGAIVGIVRTNEFGGVKVVPIMRCLRGSPLVLDAGYPD
jgi:hypothetical protein